MSLPSAVEENDVEEITRLLSTEAVDLNSRNPQGRASLHVAVGKENVELVKMLIDKNCEVDVHDSRSWTPLHQAAAKGNLEIVKTLIAAGSNVDDVDDEERTALHHAASQGSVEVVQALIDAGCNVDVRDKKLETALHMATRTGHFKVIRLLISNGSSITLQDKKGETPMHVAAESDIITVLPYLIGVHLQDLLNTKNNDGKNVLEVTTEKTKPKAAKISERAEKWEMKPAKALKAKDTPEKRDVFISYQWDHQTEARLLAKNLRSRGHSCWIDTDAAVGGTRLHRAIGKGLYDCQVMISCITPEYTKSENCENEVILAHQLRKLIIPLIIKETPWPLPNPGMAIALTPITYIDISNSLKDLRKFKGDQIDSLLTTIKAESENVASRQKKASPAAEEKTCSCFCRSRTS